VSVKIVSIVIVTWNSAKYLPCCIESLRHQTLTDFEVIVIDNGSVDDSMANLEENWPILNLHVKRLPNNLGFAAANNIGARLARGQWLALLNADAFPEPDWLEKLIEATEDYPDYSSFASRQIQANDPELLDGTGDSYHVSGVAWRRNINYPVNQYGLSIEEIFTPCAAAALYLRDAFLEVGGFDEDFFSYFEDVDLGFRLRLHGYRALFVPGAVVHHVGSTTFGINSDFSLYHSHRNLVWTFFKNMPTGLLLKYLPAHIMVNLSYMLYYTFRGRGRILWKAKWDAICGLPLIFDKRKEIQKSRTVTNSKLLASMERGWLQLYMRKYRHKR
jgi:GT2 family glycosyltransferase